MKGKPKKSAREKDLTARYLSGNLDEDRVESQQRFTRRNADAQQNRILKTSLLRAADEGFAGELESLAVGEVTQVHSLFSDVQVGDLSYLCVVRKTLSKISDTAVVVGDRVRIRSTGVTHENGQPEAVIEQVLPRDTVLTRADSFKQQLAHPIVANAENLLIVASIAQPYVKWGMIDRMIIAGLSGGLKPTICLNKIDLLMHDKVALKEIGFADEALAHYATLGVSTIRTSASLDQGLDELRGLLRGTTTVLAGHSGVGKSSLLAAVQHGLDLRVGEISKYTGKGRHTTTSARRYPLEIGGAVIDTPGVKMLGLWNVTSESLVEFFPDVEAGTAPQWRVESYRRILESL
jgi:ribosome biogenesis GTPase